MTESILCSLAPTTSPRRWAFPATMRIPDPLRFTSALSMLARRSESGFVKGLHLRLDLVEKFCAMSANWLTAANDGPLLLSAATKRAGDMAVLNSEVVATTQTSIKLGVASNSASAVLENLLGGLTANGISIHRVVH